MSFKTMHGRDAISGASAECYATINGKRYNLMSAKELEAKMVKSKVDVPILGKSGKGNKSVGWKGEGSCVLHYNQSIFRKVMKEYKDTGADLYFDMQVTNEDKTASVGRQTTVLKDCNLDEIVIAKFNADEELLDEEVSFTFEDWDMPEAFQALDGME